MYNNTALNPSPGPALSRPRALPPSSPSPPPPPWASWRPCCRRHAPRSVGAVHMSNRMQWNKGKRRKGRRYIMQRAGGEETVWQEKEREKEKRVGLQIQPMAQRRGRRRERAFVLQRLFSLSSSHDLRSPEGEREEGRREKKGGRHNVTRKRSR